MLVTPPPVAEKSELGYVRSNYEGDISVYKRRESFMARLEIHGGTKEFYNEVMNPSMSYFRTGSQEALWYLAWNNSQAENGVFISQND